MASNKEIKTVDVIINGEQAAQTLDNMRKKARELNAALEQIVEPLNSPEFARGKKAMDELNQKIAETTGKVKQSQSSWQKMLEVAGGMGMWELAKKGLDLVGKGFEWVKTVMESTSITQDQWNQTVTGMSWGYQKFLSIIATGDWSNFTNQIEAAIKAGVEYCDTLERIEKRTRALDIEQARVDLNYAKSIIQARDVNKTYDERIKIATDAVETENSLSKKRIDLAVMERDNDMKMMIVKTGLSKETITNLISETKYSDELQHKAEEYLKLKKIVDEYDEAGMHKRQDLNIEEVNQARDKMEKTAGYVKATSVIVSAYGKSTKGEYDKVAQSIANVDSTELKYVQTTQKGEVLITTLQHEEETKRESDRKKANDNIKKHIDALYEIQKALEEASVDLNTNELERARAKEEYDYRVKVAALKKKADSEKDTQAALHIALEKMEAAHLIRMMAIQEDYDAKKKTITVKTSPFSSFELPKELDKVKNDQTQIDNEIQRHLDQRMKDEAEADLLRLTREGELTYEKRKEILQQEYEMELTAAAGNSEKQYLIREQYLQKEKELIEAHTSEIIQQASNLANTVGSFYGQLIQQQNMQDDQALAKYENNIAAKKKALDNNYKAGILTKSQYDNQINILENQSAKEHDRVNKEKAEREYQYALEMIFVNEAIAIAQALTLVTGTSKHWVEAIIGMAAAVAAIIIEVAAANNKLDQAKSAQYAKGKYDVIGSDDGRFYQNVPYTGPAKTGIYPSPALISEQGGELIVDAPTTRNLQMNYPWILSAINHARTPQYAEGNYSNVGVAAVASSSRAPSTDLMLIKAINEFNDNMRNGTLAKIVYDEYQTIQGKVDLIKTDVTQ